MIRRKLSTGATCGSCLVWFRKQALRSVCGTSSPDALCLCMVRYTIERRPQMRLTGSHAATLFVEDFQKMCSSYRDGMGPLGLNAAVAAETMP